MAKRKKIIASIFFLALIAGLLSYSLISQAAPYRDIPVNFGVQPIEGKIYLKDPQLTNYNVPLGGGEIESWEVIINGESRKNYGTLGANNELTIPTIESKQAVTVYGISENNPGHMVTRTPGGILWQTSAHDPDTEERYTFLFEGDPECMKNGVSDCPGIFPAYAERVETGQIEPIPGFLRDSEGRAVTDTHRVKFASSFYFSEEEIDISDNKLPPDRATNHRIIPKKSEALDKNSGVEILDAGPSKIDAQMGWIKVSKPLIEKYSKLDIDYEITSTGEGHMHIRNYHMRVKSFWEATTYEYDVSIRVYFKAASKPDLIALDIYPNEEIVVGQQTSFTYEFQNSGQEVNDPFEVHVIAGSGETLVRKTFNGLGSGQVGTGTFTYTFTSSNPVDFFLDVDFYNAIDEADETNNNIKKTFEPGDAGEVIITGDFDIKPSPTQDYGGSFTFEPKEIEVIGCDFGYIKWRLEQGSSVHETGNIQSKNQDYGLSHRSDGYLGGKFGPGTIQVTLFVASECGDEVPVATKPIEILVDPNNEPPLFTAGFFPDRSYTRYPNMIVYEVVLGEKVTLGFVNYPPEEAPRDPEGYTPLKYHWDFAGSTSSWIRSFPSAYGFSNNREEYMNIVADEEGFHRVRVQVCDSVGACAEDWVSLNVIPPNPVAVINGPSIAKEGRPIPEPWDGSDSYSPANRKITEYIWGGTKLDVYPDPGTYNVTLKVKDSAGLESLNTATHTINVQPDLPPVAELGFLPVTLRGVSVDFTNKSRSEDGDEIVRNEVWYRYDSNNDGNYVNEIRHNITMRDNNTFSLNFDKVGNYQVCVYVEEDYGKNAQKCYTLEVTNEAPEVQFSVLGESPMPPEKELKNTNFTESDWEIENDLGESVVSGWYSISDKKISNDYHPYYYPQKSVTTQNVERYLIQTRTIDTNSPFIAKYPLGNNRFFSGNGYARETIFYEVNEDLANIESENFRGKVTNYALDRCIVLRGEVMNVKPDEDLIWLAYTHSSFDHEHYVYRISDIYSHNPSSCHTTTSVSYIDYKKIDRDDPDKNTYVPAQFSDIGRKPIYGDTARSSKAFGSAEVLAVDSEGNYFEVRYINTYPTRYVLRKYNESGMLIGEHTINHSGNPVGLSNDEKFVVIHGTAATRQRSNLTIFNTQTNSTHRNRTINGDFLLFFNDTIVMYEEVGYDHYIRFYDLNLNRIASSPSIKDTSWFSSYGSDYNLPIEMKAIVSGDGKLIIGSYFENVVIMDFSGQIEDVIPLYNLGTSSKTSARDPVDYYSDDYSDTYGFADMQLIDDGHLLLSYFREDDDYNCDGYSACETYYNYTYIIKTDVSGEYKEVNPFGGQWTHETETLKDGELQYTVRWERATPNANYNSSGFSFRIENNSNNMYRLEHNRKETRLVKIHNGNKIVLQTVSYPINLRQDYSFRVKLQGSSIRVYDYRGVPIITANDSTFREGMYGPYSNTEYFTIKDVKVILTKFDSTWVKNTAIVNYNNEYETLYSDFENDPQIPQLNKWTYRHVDRNKFLNSGDGSSGLSSLHNTTVQSPYLTFDKVGIYEVEYAATDDPYPEAKYRYPNNTFAEFRSQSLPHKENVIVHRRPIVDDIRYTIRANGTIDWQIEAYDPDRWLSPSNYSAPDEGKTYHDTKGIFEYKYQYLTPSGELKTGKLTRPQEAGEYTVYVSVRDEYGAWSDLAETSVTVSTPAPPDLPPNPGFTLNRTTLNLDQNLVITSTASDPEDGPASNLKHTYYIKKTDGYEQMVSTNRGTWNYSPDERGSYSIRQVVEDSAGNTAELTKTFEVVNRAPNVEVTTPSSANAASPTKFETLRPIFSWRYSDPDGDEQRQFEVKISNSSNGANVLNSGVIHSDQQEWKATADLPEDTTMYIRTRVHDGFTWSAWSEPKYFYIHTNDPPAAELIFPSGTQTAPTIVETTKPTITWRQVDPNAGTIFTGFEFQFLDEAGGTLYTSGQRVQHTSEVERSWALDVELPPAMNIQVQVRVKDEEIWSGWSEPKWLYINRPPVADFDYSPKPVWEGDRVALNNRSADPDGDELTYTWEIVEPDGNRVTFTDENVVYLFAAPGRYEVTLKAADKYTSDQITRTIEAGELILLPDVRHTELWREYHLEKGHEVDVDPKDFYSGEQFVVKAQVSPAPVEQVRAWLNTTDKSEQAVFLETELTEQSAERYHGLLNDPQLASIKHGLKEGIEQIHFEVIYGNGVKKRADVPLRIIGLALEAVGVHRVQ